MKKYDSYKDSGVRWLGEIPSHWEMLPGLAVFQENKCKNSDLSVNNVLSLSYGKIIEKKDINEGLVPAEYNTYQIVHPGYIIIRCTDLQNDKVSLRTGLVKNDGIITNAYLGLVINKEYNYSYVHYFLHAWDITKEIYRHGSGLRQSLSWLDLRRLPILLPSPQEQEAIANYLDSATSKIDEAIAQQQKMIDLLNERKQIIINSAVTKGLDPNVKMKPSGIDWIGDIPEGWEVTPIKFLAKIYSGATPSTNNETYWDGNIPWVTPADFKTETKYIGKGDRFLTQLGVDSCSTYIVPKGSIIFSKRAPVGQVSISTNELCTNQGCLSCVPHKKIQTEYLFYVLSKYQNELESFSAGTTFREISLQTFKNFKVPIPTIVEQVSIISYLKKIIIGIDQAKSKFEAQISLLQERKQIIINEVVTGKVKVG